MKKLIYFLLMTTLFHGTAFAAAVQTDAIILKKPFLLGDAESENLKAQLAQQNMAADTFTLTMRCNKYKRTPQSKSRTVNCVAYYVDPSSKNQSAAHK